MSPVYPMDTTDRPDKPDCFGDLDVVFPMGPGGLRRSPETCIQCVHKTECLTDAMQNESGLRFQEEMIDRAYRLKKITLFERWSKRKKLYQKRKEKIKEK